MTRQETIRWLNGRLLDEMEEYRAQAAQFSRSEPAQRRLLRSLMNVRTPMPLHQDFLSVQDELLTAEAAEKGIADARSLPVAANHPRLALWQGDITRLRADVIVNAANSALLGCFCPCHGCIETRYQHESHTGLQHRSG